MSLELDGPVRLLPPCFSSTRTLLITIYLRIEMFATTALKIRELQALVHSHSLQKKTWSTVLPNTSAIFMASSRDGA